MVQLFCDLRSIIRNQQNGVQIPFWTIFDIWLWCPADWAERLQMYLKIVSKMSSSVFNVVSMLTQFFSNIKVVSMLSQSCLKVFSKLSHFFQSCPNFFSHQNCQNCSYVMTDKSRGLSRTVLSDQLGRQRRLTLKSQPPIHKMQPISLLHFLQNLQFF